MEGKKYLCGNSGNRPLIRDQPRNNLARHGLSAYVGSFVAQIQAPLETGLFRHGECRGRCVIARFGNKVSSKQIRVMYSSGDKLLEGSLVYVTFLPR